MRVPLIRKQKVRVEDAEEVYTVMQQILLRESKIDRGKEHFWIVCLSDAGRIILIELLGVGAESSGVPHPTDVFSFALQKQAKKFIIVHSRPPGRAPAPSPEDLDVTDKLYQVGRFLKLPLVDHLIINEKKYFSFRETGALERLSKSKKYALKYKEEEEKRMQRGREEGKRSARKRAGRKGGKKAGKRAGKQAT